MHTNEEILNILLNSIKSRGITEKECLISNEINTSFLTDWKKGRLKAPSYDKIIKLATYLEISLDVLFLGSELHPKNLKNNSVCLTDTITDDEKEWLNIYREIPPENQPHLLAMARAFSLSLPKAKNNQKSRTSPSTDETAAAIHDSNIA